MKMIWLYENKGGNSRTRTEIDTKFTDTEDDDDTVVAFNYNLTDTNTDTELLNHFTKTKNDVQLADKQDNVTDVSDIEIGYLSGVTSSIHAQVDGKSPAEESWTSSMNIRTWANYSPVSAIVAPGLNIYFAELPVTLPANTFDSDNIRVFTTQNIGSARGQATCFRQ